jgi:hypothetical protein
MIDVSDTLLLSFTGLAAELLEETAIAAWMLKSSVSEIGYCSIIPTATDGVHDCLHCVVCWCRQFLWSNRDRGS